MGAFEEQRSCPTCAQREKRPPQTRILPHLSNQLTTQNLPIKYRATLKGPRSFFQKRECHRPQHAVLHSITSHITCTCCRTWEDKHNKNSHQLPRYSWHAALHSSHIMLRLLPPEVPSIRETRPEEVHKKDSQSETTGNSKVNPPVRRHDALVLLRVPLKKPHRHESLKNLSASPLPTFEASPTCKLTATNVAGKNTIVKIANAFILLTSCRAILDVSYHITQSVSIAPLFFFRPRFKNSPSEKS